MRAFESQTYSLHFQYAFHVRPSRSPALMKSIGQLHFEHDGIGTSPGVPSAADATPARSCFDPNRRPFAHISHFFHVPAHASWISCTLTDVNPVSSRTHPPSRLARAPFLMRVSSSIPFLYLTKSSVEYRMPSMSSTLCPVIHEEAVALKKRGTQRPEGLKGCMRPTGPILRTIAGTAGISS